MLQFGMPTLIEITSLEDTMQLCKELGLDFVELNMNLPQYQAEHLADISYLKSLQEQYGVGYTIHLDENLNVCDFNKAVADAYTDTVVRAIKAAKAIGVSVLNMHMNHGVHFTLPDRKVQLFEQYFENYMSAWKKFRDVCECEINGADIKICMENTDGYRSYEKSAIAFLLQSDVFGLTWDIGHSNAAKNVDEAFILEHRDRLCHFHIHDSQGKQDHMTLGTGEIDLEQRLSVAEEGQCRCVVETKTVAALKESVKWIESRRYHHKKAGFYNVNAGTGV